MFSGLTIENINTYYLKKSIDSSIEVWSKLIAKSSFPNESDVTETFSNATDKLAQIIGLDGVDCGPVKLHVAVPDYAILGYVKLSTVAYCSLPVEKFADERLMRVVVSCMRFVDPVVSSDKAIDEFVEGFLCVLETTITHLRGIIERKKGSSFRFLDFSTAFTAMLASLAVKYSNRKKIYVTYCDRLLGPLATLLELVAIIGDLCGSESDLSAAERLKSALLDFTKSCLFYDEKNIEDVAAIVIPEEVPEVEMSHSNATQRADIPRLLLVHSSGNHVNPLEPLNNRDSKNGQADIDASGDGNVKGNSKEGGLSLTALKKVMTAAGAKGDKEGGKGSKTAADTSSASFKTSYHGNLYSAVMSAVNAVCRGDDVTGLGNGLAGLLKVYVACSKILAASASGGSSTDQSRPSSGTLSAGSSLQDRRKHVSRIVQLAVNVLTTVDNAYRRLVAEYLEAQGDRKGPKNEALQNLLRALAKCASTRKAVLQTLLDSLDEVGGSSLLATNDALQPLAARLHSFCTYSLSVVVASGGAYNQASMAALNNDESQTLSCRVLAAELDCARIIASIDHRAITTRQEDTVITNKKVSTGKTKLNEKQSSQSTDQQSASLVLRAIASAGVSVVDYSSPPGSHSASQLHAQLTQSKESLLATTIELYNDLRRMDDFVKEILRLCQLNSETATEANGSSRLSSFVDLLGSFHVQSVLSRAFAALPMSQLELVWTSLSLKETTEASANMDDDNANDVSGTHPAAIVHSAIVRRCQLAILRALMSASSIQPAHSQSSSIMSSVSDESLLYALSGASSVSFSNALPDSIVSVMGLILAQTQEYLRSNQKGSSVDEFKVACATASTLLQLGSVAVVLHKRNRSSNSTSPAPEKIDDDAEGGEGGGKTVSRSPWERFRDTAYSLAGTQFFKKLDMRGSGNNNSTQNLWVAVTCISLSAFCASYESISDCDLPSDADVDAVSIDQRVGEMIRDLGAYFAHCLGDSVVNSSAGKGKNKNRKDDNDDDDEPVYWTANEDSGTDKKTKKKTAIANASEVDVSSSHSGAVDFLLLLVRSLSVWSYLSPATVSVEHLQPIFSAHFHDVIQAYDADAHHRFLLRHQALCQLLGTPEVLDCPVVVNSVLASVELLVSSVMENVSSHSDALKSLFSTLPLEELLASAAGSAVESARASASDLRASVAEWLSLCISKMSKSKAPAADAASATAASVAADLLRIGLKTRRSSSRGSTDTDDNSVDQLAPLVGPLIEFAYSQPAGSLNQNASARAASQLLPILVDTVLSRVSGELSMAEESQTASKTRGKAANAKGGSLSVFTEIVSRVISVVAPKASAGKTAKGARPVEAVVDINGLAQLYRRCCSLLGALEGDNILSALRDKVGNTVKEVFATLSNRVVSADAGADTTSVEGFARCMMLADTLRVLAKLHDTEELKEFLKDLQIPALPAINASDNLTAGAAAAEVHTDGWFLLTGTIFHLQRRLGFLFSVRSAVATAAAVKQAIILSCYAYRGKTNQPTTENKNVDEEEGVLSAASVCISGLIECTPHIVRGSIAQMLSSLVDLCVSVPANSPSTDTMVNGTPSSGGERATSLHLLARFALLGVDCLISTVSMGRGDHSNGDAMQAAIEDILGRIAASVSALSFTDTANAKRDILVSLVHTLRRGFSAIQQQKRTNKRQKRTRTEGNPQRGDDDDALHGGDSKELSLSKWASACLNILSIALPTLLLAGEGGRGSADTKSFAGEEAQNAMKVDALAHVSSSRLQVAAHALGLIEQILSCDLPGGSSLPLLGTSIGTIGTLLTTAVRTVVSVEELSEDVKHRAAGTRKSSTATAAATTATAPTTSSVSVNTASAMLVQIDPTLLASALRSAGRALTAASASRELSRHTHVLAASVVDVLAQRPITANTREFVLPGVFSLFDRCRQRQRQQMFNTVDAQTRAVLSELHALYLRDFKFTGQ